MASTAEQISTYGGSLVRHALTAAGAILVAKGFLTSTDVTLLGGVLAPKILGAALYAIGQGWSFFQKKKQIKAGVA